MDVFFYLVLLAFMYVFYRVWYGFARLFEEYFVLWNMVGQGRRNINAKRLHAYVYKTELVDEVSVNELYRFVTSMLHTEATIKQFYTLLVSYKYAVTCREIRDGSLRGAFLVDINLRELDG